MLILFTLLHVVVCVFLVIVVLLQSGKAADLAGAFGGMGSQTAFGPRGSATVLSKATTLAAALFMVSSLTLSILASRSAGTASSVVERNKGAAGKTPAAAPAPNSQLPVVPGGAPTVTTTPGGGAPGKTMPVPVPMTPPAQQAPAQKK